MSPEKSLIFLGLSITFVKMLVKACITLQSGWTKGRLNCPHCQCRIGAFDFVSGGGGGGGGLDQAIHLVKSKVDESIIHSSSNI